MTAKTPVTFARASVLALAGLALAAPLACLAAPSSAAAQNCAQALATRLNARLAAVHQQPNFTYPPFTVQDNQYILHAREADGRQSAPMVCTVNRQGRVVSVHRLAPIQALLWGSPTQ